MSADCHHLPAFPTQSAFVVQWHRMSNLASGKIRGRVEHVTSRQATTFESLTDLLTFMQGVLDQTHPSVQEPP